MIVETFRKRVKRVAQQGKVEVYQYENLPREFRVQVIHIWVHAIGPTFRLLPYDTPPVSNQTWDMIEKQMSREAGVFELGRSGNADPFARCQEYLINGSTGEALDIIEFSFRIIERLVSGFDPHHRQMSRIDQSAQEAVAELNARFREHGIGYWYEDGGLFRIDSQYLHAEATVPALTLLHRPGFEGPCQEFMEAHDHYRNGNAREAIQSALKSFESTMKAICGRRRWRLPSTAAARELLAVLFDRGLISPELQSHFSGLRSVLESGLPTVRNRTPSVGHGQGPNPIAVPDYLAAFALHQAAANIVLLVEADKALR